MLRDLLTRRTAVLAVLAVTTACQSAKETSPGREKATSSLAKPRNEPTNRPVYRHSVLPGGVQSGDEVKERLAQDAVAARHYKGIDPVRLKPAHLKQDRRAYVSYRVGEKIYWTRQPQLLKAGELVLTDGEQTVRARCGNRLEDEPQEEVQSADESPADEEFEQIAELDGSWPPTPSPGGRPGRQLASLMEPLFGWDPGGALPSGGALPGQTGSGGGSAPGTSGGSPLSPGGLGIGAPFRDPGGSTGTEPPGPPPEGRSPFEPTPPPGPGPLPGPPRPPILPPSEPPPPEDDPLPPEFPDPEPEGPGPGPSTKPPVYGPPVPPPPTSPPRDSPPGTPTPKGPPPGPDDPPPGPKPPPSPKPPRTPDRPVPPDFPTPEPPQDIPEPASFLLMVAGAGALLWLRRRSP